MRKQSRWLTVPVGLGLVVLIGIGAIGGQADGPKKLTAEDVITLWKPIQDGVEDFQQFVVSPKESQNMMVATFRIVGPSFERLWNHYAELCGIRDRYEAKRMLISGGTGGKGSYVVSDRVSLDAKSARVLSVFLLRTDRYTVTATIQPDLDGKAMHGSIAAVLP
jgi:hypothetical protein